MSLLGDLLRGFLKEWDERVERAGGDVIEALHGHVCGAGCWHTMMWKTICVDCFAKMKPHRDADPFRLNKWWYPSKFGDFSLCNRCNKSVTSKDAAYKVDLD